MEKKFNKKKIVKQSSHNKVPVQERKPLKPARKISYYDVAGFIILTVLGIVIYSNSFNCSFHFDDLLRIVDNVKIRDISNVSAWWNYYPTRPLGTLSFVLNYHFFQLDVWYWHLINLIIHLINTILVWWLTYFIFCTPALKELSIARDKKVIAFFTALLFVSHPAATQSVTYIVQRLASMTALFYLLTLVIYIKARLSAKGDRYKALLISVSFITAAIAMMIKENAFTLPFVILLVEIFFMQTKKIRINFKDYRVILLVMLFLCAIVIIPLRLSLNILKPIPASYMNTTTITPLNYLLTQFSVIVKYIQLLILPINQNLDYDFPVSTGFFQPGTILCFLVLVSLILAAIFSYRKYRVISFGISWFFLTLMIESSFIPIRDVIFEHRTYLPSVGFFLVLSTGIYLLLWKRYKIPAILVFIVIAGSNSYLTYERNKIWKNDLTLWTDVVEKSPNKARALYNLGLVYDYLGQWDRSIELYSKAIVSYPEDRDAYINRGVALGNEEKWNNAISDYSKAIDLDPRLAKSFINRGIAYSKLGQWTNTLKDESTALEIDPKNVVAFYNRGIAYGNCGQWNNAISDQTEAINIDPKYTDAYNYRGIAFGNTRQWDKAINDFTKTIEINPASADAYYNRGNSYYSLRQYDKAISDYTRSLEFNKNSANAYYNRAQAYAALDQWDKAISDYNKTIEVDPNYSGAYYYRDMAYKRYKILKK